MHSLSPKSGPLAPKTDGANERYPYIDLMQAGYSVAFQSECALSVSSGESYHSLTPSGRKRESKDAREPAKRRTRQPVHRLSCSGRGPC
ncbi:hypothetical protein ABIB66_008181 [Bradyrhizobium sp. F1.13.3]